MLQDSSSNKKMIENEAVFRKQNEKVQKDFDKLKQIAKEDGQDNLAKEPETPLYFYCECSDENCRQRIQLDLAEHTKIHKNRRAFVVKPGHQVGNIERVVEERLDYNIVEKFTMPPESPGKLNPTAVNNSTI
jgi:hypothetical protein